MKVLIIKTSSMGDVLHTLPALTDAGRFHPGISFDWVVEEAFAEIPAWHPLVDKVIPFSWRRIRKKIFSRTFIQEIARFRSQLRQTKYDYVIDAQSLVKSAAMSLFAQGVRCGYTSAAAREPLASLFYQKRFAAPAVKEQHAIVRIRTLFASVLGYNYTDLPLNYGIHLTSEAAEQAPYVVLLHGTTWETKHWPEAYWMELAKLLSAQGLKIKLLWGSEAEKARAMRISEVSSAIEVMPKMTLRQVADLLANAAAVAAVDTGLAHLSAALATPTVSVYGPTNPVLTGAQGQYQIHLSSKFSCAPCLQDKCQFTGDKTINPPCFAEITPVLVATQMKKAIEKKL